jgi:hypothetical protein
MTMPRFESNALREEGVVEGTKPVTSGLGHARVCSPQLMTSPPAENVMFSSSPGVIEAG